ncbi:SDR family oxidoreductase [Haliangium sp.]|uniref:SDR family oxidoreductase n=1 Tax=Haliangium sp. TaxID=2663208 RepID=UPI003D13156C
MPASHAPLAVVTGGNRGLGRETCRQLAELGYRVLLTSRDTETGEPVALAMHERGLDVQFHALDVTDRHSVDALAGFLRSEGRPIAALVNNAGVALEGFDAEVVAATLAVNYRGPIRVTDTLRPLLSEDARVVMVSSGVGELAGLPPALRSWFEDDQLDRAGLDKLVAQFERLVGEGVHADEGWPSSAYRISKVALGAFTRILARELEGTQILVNAVCPGWVRTDMGGHSAPRAVEEGADTIVWAATLPDDGPSGGFFRDRTRISW